MALSLALGLYRLGDESLWSDEGITASSVRRSWGGILDLFLGNRATHVFYYSLLKVWSALGTSEVALRSFSVLCMAAAAGLLAVLGARLFGQLAGACAGVLFAINPFVVQYAQEARAYALVVLLGVAMSLLLVRALATPSIGRWLGWALAGVLLFYANLIAGGTLLVAHVLAVVLRRDRPTLLALLAGGVLTIAVIPLAVLLSRGGSEGVGWIPATEVSDLYPAVRLLAGGRGVLVVLLAAFASIAIVSALRRRTGDGLWAVGFCSLIAATPLVLTFIVSQAVPVFLPRYMIVTVIGIVLLAAAGIAELGGVAVSLSALVLLLGASLPALRIWYGETQKEDWRGAVALVDSKRLPTDAVVAPRWQDAFRYYYGASRFIGASDALAPGRLEGDERAWVVLRAGAGREPISWRLEVKLSRRYREIRQWRFHGIFVRLYAPS